MGLEAGLVALSTLLLITLVARQTAAAGAPFNVTTLLSTYPSYSVLNNYLTSTGVANEINARSSVTLLCTSNAVLTAFLAGYPNIGTAEIANLLRYQLLLEYLSIPELQTITPGNPSTVTTLYQTTGQASGNSGSVNIYNSGTKLLVGQADVNTTPNTTIVTNVTQIPYNISLLETNSVVAPTGFGAPPTVANISAILEGGKNFNTFNNLLQTTGVAAIFEARESLEGITIFAPTDSAFQALGSGVLGGLTAQQSIDLLEYHALATYYPLGSLQTLNNPATPTVATAQTTADMYLVNVSSASTGVLINSGINAVSIASTLYDKPSTVVFSIDAILQPPALFSLAPSPAPALVPAPAPGPLGPVPAPAPSPLTPTPAPSPLTPAPAPSPLSPTPTPTPTPSSAPAPSPFSAAPAPSALTPGPPAPPAGIIPGEPTAAPEGSPGKSDAVMASMSLAVLAVVVLMSSVVM